MSASKQASCGEPRNLLTCWHKHVSNHTDDEDLACDCTYYAGNNSTFNAVATIAHCAIDGYNSDIAIWLTGGLATGEKTRVGSRSEVSVTCSGRSERLAPSSAKVWNVEYDPVRRLLRVR